MSYILILWVYLVLLFWTFGFSLSFFLQKSIKIQTGKIHFSLIFFLGFSVLTILSIILSLFFPLGKEVSFFYFLLFLILIIILRKEILRVILDYGRELKEVHILVILLFFINFFIVLSKSASPSELFDEGGYYMPFIKWIENFPVVPGLGNIEFRFGFNSSFHIVSSVFTFSWLVNYPFFDLNGIIAISVSVFFFQGLNELIKDKFKRTGDEFILNVVKSLLIVILFRNFMTSTSADFTNIYLALVINLILLEKLLNKDFAINFHLYLLIFFSIVLTTIKFSSVLILIFVTFFLIFVLLKNSFNRGLIFTYIIVGMLTIFPWLFRSYIMTGYILYPLYFVDFFSPDWKVKETFIKTAFVFVETCAKNEFLPTQKVLNLSLNQWFPSWFERRFLIEKIFFILIGIVTISNFFFYKSLNKKIIVLQVFLFLLIVFWFFKFPDFRFGYGFILIYIFIGLANYLSLLPSDKLRGGIVMVFIIGMTIINVKKTYAETHYTNILLTPAHQRESVIYKKENHGSYTFNFSDYCWYTPYPCIRVYDPDLELRGSSLEDGFRIKNNK